MKFINRFFTDMKRIGAVAPTSKASINKLLNKSSIDKTTKIVVEFGPGTGCTTRQILNRLGYNAKLISIELDKGLYSDFPKELLQDDRLTLINGSATDIVEILDTLDIANYSVDAVFSTIPMSFISKDDRDSLFGAIYDNVLTDSGEFLQIQYSPMMRKELSEYFAVKNSVCLWNIPPATLFNCRRIQNEVKITKLENKIFKNADTLV